MQQFLILSAIFHHFYSNWKKKMEKNKRTLIIDLTNKKFEIKINLNANYFIAVWKEQL